MSAVLRCKLMVEKVTQTFDSDGKATTEQVRLRAVYGEGDTENAKWSKYTPSASFEIYINNPDAFGVLRTDHEFYVDFIPANHPDN